jgi:hypothetical protein
MAGEKHLSGWAAAGAFFRDQGAAGAQQFKSGLEAIKALLRRRHCRLAGGNPELGGRGVVDQQEATVLVDKCDTGRQHPEHVPQHPQLGIGAKVVIA